MTPPPPRNWPWPVQIVRILVALVLAALLMAAVVMLVLSGVRPI